MCVCVVRVNVRECVCVCFVWMFVNVWFVWMCMWFVWMFVNVCFVWMFVNVHVVRVNVRECVCVVRVDVCECVCVNVREYVSGSCECVCDSYECSWMCMWFVWMFVNVCMLSVNVCVKCECPWMCVCVVRVNVRACDMAWRPCHMPHPAKQSAHQQIIATFSSNTLMIAVPAWSLSHSTDYSIDLSEKSLCISAAWRTKGKYHNRSYINKLIRFNWVNISDTEG